MKTMQAIIDHAAIQAKQISDLKTELKRYKDALKSLEKILKDRRYIDMFEHSHCDCWKCKSLAVIQAAKKMQPKGLKK